MEITGLGLILFPIGVILLIIGLLALRGRELVAGVVGSGGVPEVSFVSVIVTWRPPPDRPTQFYYDGAVDFGAITLVGLVALVVVWWITRRPPCPPTTYGRTGTQPASS